MDQPRKPLLIYDGECQFCCRWIARWRGVTGERVDYRSSQEVGADYPTITAEEFSRAVQWVDADGHRESGAPAVLCALATTTATGRVLLSLYRKVPPFAWAADAAYATVAGNRSFFSRLTRWF